MGSLFSLVGAGNSCGDENRERHLGRDGIGQGAGLDATGGAEATERGRQFPVHSGPGSHGPVKRPDILIISDATGATAQSVLTSVLVQFEDAQFVVRRFPFVRKPEQLEKILAPYEQRTCIVVYTLVSSELRSMLEMWARRCEWSCVDVMGPLLSAFSSILHHGAEERPGAYRHGEEEGETHRLAEAIAFTLAHDDGNGLESIDEAAVIILGASRTGKTPTSIFLSCRQLRVANVPIIKDLPLPDAVARSPTRKVGFRMSDGRLMELRAERMRRFERRNMRSYLSREGIAAELRYCEKLYRQIPGCHTIDVTNRSVEEVSEWIVRNVL